MKMKTSLAFCALLSVATSAVSQTVPILPKEWKGTTTFSSSGSPFILGQPDEFSYHDGERSLTVLRQEGRHLELEYRGAKGPLPRWVGVLSKDGKQLQIAGKQDSILLTISGDTMSGCGTARGTARSNGEGFNEWLTQYGAFCLDFTAVK